MSQNGTTGNFPVYEELISRNRPVVDVDVYAAIAGNGGARRAELLDETDVSAQQFHRSADRLIDSGVVEKTGWGRYEKTPLAGSPETVSFYVSMGSSERLELAYLTVTRPGPVGVEEVAEAVDRHPERVRQWMNEMSGAGLVERKEHAAGQAKQYRLTGKGREELDRVESGALLQMEFYPDAQNRSPRGYDGEAFTSEPQVVDTHLIAQKGCATVSDLASSTGGNEGRTRARLLELEDRGILESRQRDHWVEYGPTPVTETAYREGNYLSFLPEIPFSSGDNIAQSILDFLERKGIEEPAEAARTVWERWREEGILKPTGDGSEQEYALQATPLVAVQ